MVDSACWPRASRAETGASPPAGWQGQGPPGTVIKLMESNEGKHGARENVLLVAKRAAAPGAAPLITSDYL
jgi:hypothetical protein